MFQKDDNLIFDWEELQMLWERWPALFQMEEVSFGTKLC